MHNPESQVPGQSHFTEEGYFKVAGLGLCSERKKLGSCISDGTYEGTELWGTRA